jgi:hypothetical protein
VRAKQFLFSQKWTSLGITLTVVVLFLIIRRLPIFKGTAQPQTD